MIFSRPRCNHNITQGVSYDDLGHAEKAHQITLSPVFPVLDVDVGAMRWVCVSPDYILLYFDIASTRATYVATGWRGYPARIRYALYRAELALMKWLVRHTPLTHDPMYLPAWRRMRLTTPHC